MDRNNAWLFPGSGVALLCLFLTGCAGGGPSPTTPAELTDTQRQDVAKIFNGGKPLPKRLPAYPTGSAEPQDEPGCKETLKVKNHKFFFRPATVSMIRVTGLKPWAFLRHDVNPAGRAVNIRIEKSAGLEPYDVDAVATLKRWEMVLPEGKNRMTGCIAKFRIT